MQGRQMTLWEGSLPAERTHTASRRCGEALVTVGEDRLHGIGAQVNGPRRWVALVAPPREAREALPGRMGLDQDRVLMVFPRRSGIAGAAERALASPTVAAVVVWADSLALEELTRVRRAADGASAQGFLVLPAAEAEGAADESPRLVG